MFLLKVMHKTGLKVTHEQINLDKSKFDKKELSLIDIEGLSRHELTVHFKEVDDDVILALRDFIRNQYKIPMKYIKCEHFQYVATKRDMMKSDEDGDYDYMYIEPLNNNYPLYIGYIPVNQSLPLDTSATLNINMHRMADLEPDYYFLRSNSIVAKDGIEDVIKKENKDSIYLKPWLQNVHIGSLDIDSKLIFKGKVAMTNTEVCNSMTLFGFNRDDDNKLFRIFTFNCYNILPKNIFEMMLKQPVNDQCKEFCEAVLKQCK